MANQQPLSLSSLFYAAGSLLEVMSHVSSFPAVTQERDDGEEGRKREREGKVCSSDHRQFLVSLLLADSPSICSCILHLSICRLLPCCSKDEKDKKRGLTGFDLFFFRFCLCPSSTGCSPICPSFFHSALLALGFSLMTHSPPELLLYRSRRCVSGSRQCSPAENTQRITKSPDGY